MLAVLQAVQDSRPRGGVLPPVDENYWQNVMLDPRGRTPADETNFEADSYFGNRGSSSMPSDRLQCSHGILFNHGWGAPARFLYRMAVLSGRGYQKVLTFKAD